MPSDMPEKENYITLGNRVLILTNVKKYIVVKLNPKKHKKKIINTAHRMKFSIKDFFSKCDQICRLSHLLKKSLLENFIFVQ